jgi:Cytochrome P450
MNYLHRIDSLSSHVTSLSCFTLPRHKRKAQEELDAVTGRERLPNFGDRRRLPFVDAMCKEVLRWRPVAPLGASIKRLVNCPEYLTLMSPVAIPHATRENIVYRGYFIPRGAQVSHSNQIPCLLTHAMAGALVIGNTW